RTVYGLDADQNGSIDTGNSIYDYFTRLSSTQQRSLTKVTFLQTTQSINTSLFQIRGIANPSGNCVYSRSFTTGSYALLNRTISVFDQRLASAITALPGTIVQ